VILPARIKRRFRPLDIAMAVLLAGWVPSILMAVVSYTILTRTLESKILVDRRTLVQTLSRLLGADFVRTTEVLEYYQTLPTTQRMVLRPHGDALAQQWLSDAYYSHPRLDGMFLTDAAGKLISSLPFSAEMIGQPFFPNDWMEPTSRLSGCYVSAVAPRLPDKRLATFVTVAIRSPQDGQVLGYLGASILVERLGKRIAGFQFGEQSVAQVVDQNGYPLFTEDYMPATTADPARRNELLKALQDNVLGFFNLRDNMYTHHGIEGTDWTAVLEQPLAVAYRPVRELVSRTVLLAGWLVIGTAVAAWLVSRLYRGQIAADERIARETFFSEKILANIPTGIALVDPVSGRFLQTNETFREMAHSLAHVPRTQNVSELGFAQVPFGLGEMFRKVAETGTPYIGKEQQVAAADGRTHFLTFNLLSLQDAALRFQGVLFLIEDNTADIAIRKELIAANAAKDQFLALLSHELRNPLSPVITMVAELEKRLDGDPEIEKPLTIIRRNVELEARLIDDLLDITRIAHGKLQLTPEVVNAHHVLQRAIEICQREIETKPLELVVGMEAQDHHIKGDPARIQQVFWNLIKNAVKFTPVSGRITIRTFNRGNRRLVIEVSDTGIGIEPDRIDKIFRAFEQADGSITRRFGGLGLGLAISKAMVEAHGGTLSVRSSGRDQGSTFTIELDTVEAGTEGPAEPRLPTLAGQHAGAHILLVDDHEDTCLGMKMLLERRGYRVKTAHDVAGALEAAAREQFDLLISDLGLPDATGFDLMERLRARGDELPGIALSGFGMESDIERSHSAGFLEHMIKPINVERLDDLLKKMVRRSAGPVEPGMEVPDSR
jgi:signal transduction histidine kinase/CheY-like chemotaxis protein